MDDRQAGVNRARERLTVDSLWSGDLPTDDPRGLGRARQGGFYRPGLSQQQSRTREWIGRTVVTKPGFKEMGRRTRELAVEHTDGSLGVVLEGGYTISHLPFANPGVFEGLLDVETGIEDPYDFEEFHDEHTDVIDDWLGDAREKLATRWNVGGA